MNLYHRAIQRDRFDLDANDLFTLQFREHAIQHATPGPAVHSRVNRMPSAETPGQSTPLAAMLGDIKNRIQHLQVRQADIAALSRQAMPDPLILGFGKFHPRSIRSNEISVNTPYEMIFFAVAAISLMLMRRHRLLFAWALIFVIFCAAKVSGSHSAIADFYSSQRMLEFPLGFVAYQLWKRGVRISP